MATAIQIRETAAENLGILALEGETLDSAKVADLDQAYIEVYNELQGLDLTTWGATEDVPDKYAKSVAMLVAEARAVKYQVADAKYQRIKIEGSGINGDGAAMRMIRRLQAAAKMGTTEIENF